MCHPIYLVFLFQIIVVSPAVGKQYEFNFIASENSPERTQIGDLRQNADGSSSSVLSIDLTDASTYFRDAKCRDIFKVDTKTAQVFVNKEPDRENICPDSTAFAGYPTSPKPCICTFSVITRNNDFIKVHVTIEDINDHKPKFPSSVKFISISESASEGYEQSLDPAVDRDVKYSKLEYTLARSGSGTDNVASIFDVRYEKTSSELKLRLKAPLDYERVRQYNATLDVCDNGKPEQCGSQLLVINIRDENDNGPVFPESRVEAQVAENVTEGTVVVRVAATDRDSGENGRLVYRKKSNTGLGGLGGSIGRANGPSSAHFFGVNEETGDVYVQQALRYSKSAADRVTLQIEASDHGNPIRRAVATVLIRIIDVNNYSPTIKVEAKSSTSHCVVDEDGPRVSVVAHLIISDKDDPNTPGGKFKCRLTAGEPQFRLRSTKNADIYRLYTNDVFDCETQDLYKVRVACTDDGGLSSHRDIPVRIRDKNEFMPSFDGTPYEAHVPENSAINTHVITVRASDKDRTAHLLYSIDRDGLQYFRIEAETGAIFTKQKLDREKIASHRFETFVTDTVEGTTRHIGKANVTVFVSDVNDNGPTVSKPLHFTVDENTPEDGIPAASVSVGRLHAIDPDDRDNGEVFFRLMNVRVPPTSSLLPPVQPPPNNTFHLREDGALFLMHPLDREVHKELLLDVQVSDRGIPRKSTSCTVTITVRDANDNPPEWKYPTTHDNSKNISSLANEDYTVTRVRAVDPDFDSTVTYSLVRGGRYFTIDDKQGHVRVRTRLTPGVYRLKFRASDSGQPRQSSDIEFLVRVYYQDPSAPAGITGRYGMNLPLVIAMIGVTCIICVSLVIAIVVVRKKSGASSRHLRSGSEQDGFGSGVAESTQKWVQEGVNGTNGGPGGGGGGNLYSSGHNQWMRPEIFSSTTSPAVSTTYYHGNSVDKYHHNTPVSQAAGHQSQVMRMHGLPVDMEVASADSGHGASEEEGLQTGDQRSKEMRLCAQRTPCPILPEDSVVQCGCSSTTVGGITAAPTTVIAGQHPFVTLPLYDYSRTFDPRVMPMVGLNNTSNTLGPAMSSFRTNPVLPPRQGSLPTAGLPERRASQSNV